MKAMDHQDFHDELCRKSWTENRMKILPNNVAVIEGDTTHGVWCATEGLVHEMWFAEEICKHIKPGDIVVQGGANIGTLTRAILDHGANVCAFEVNPEAYECLWYNCPKALFRDRILAVNAALSGELGWCHLNVDHTNAGASWIQPIEFGARGAIRRVSLDSFGPTAEANVRLILADIEGHETSALRGARQTITRCRPVIICEVNRGALTRAGSSDAELLGLIEEMGYSIKVMQPQCKIGDEMYDIECVPLKA